MKAVVLLLCIFLLLSGLGLFMGLFVIGASVWAIRGLYKLARPAAAPRRR